VYPDTEYPILPHPPTVYLTPAVAPTPSEPTLVSVAAFFLHFTFSFLSYFLCTFWHAFFTENIVWGVVVFGWTKGSGSGLPPDWIFSC
jgi:hypothetical protein